MIAALRPQERLSTHVGNVTKVERFFRMAAGLRVDKQDVKRYTDFINGKVGDLLVRGKTTAILNGHDAIMPFDLPITKGLQATMEAFERIDGTLHLRSNLDHVTARPPLDLPLGADTEAMLPNIVGGLSIALGRTFKIIEPDLKNPQTTHWQRAIEIFDLLL